MKFIIILLLFLLFIIVQVYFYKIQYVKNDLFLKNVESFENKLKKIDEKNILLEDTSIELLLEQYNNINKYSIGY